MPTVIAYQIVQSDTAADLENKVQQLVSQGYEPQGAPVIFKDNSDWNFFQAVVKKQIIVP